MSDPPLPTRMEATSSLGAHVPEEYFSQKENLGQYVPPNPNGYSGRNSAKQPLILHLNGLQPHYGAQHSSHPHSGSTVSSQSTRLVTNGADAGNRDTDCRTNGGLDGDASRSTPNESTGSTSLLSTSSQRKSTSPSTVMNSLPSSSASTDSRGTSIAPTFPKYRPRSSIPSRLPAPVYAQQCVAAAYASRLNPYALHRKEQEALQDHLCHLHVTVYLNIRNGILRLWTRNSMVSVSKEEAIGCAKDYRWMNLASFAYEWLVRNGYINFGCVEIPMPLVTSTKARRKESPVIVVIGAGMAGLGCARQLEGFFNHYHEFTTSPRVIVLEGRRRIGGRIYSHPLRSLQSSTLPPGLVPKAEMGAQIVVGFDHGNPLDQIIRGQLALSYHLLRDISTIYDIDGSPVDEVRDAMDERLYNDILDRSGFYRHKSVIIPMAEGDRDLIDSGRDTSTGDGVTIRQYEEARAAGTIGLLYPAKRVRRGVGHKTAEIKTTGAPVAELDHVEEHPAAFACQAMGWKLNNGVSARDTIKLDAVATSSQFQTLGKVMDDGVRQYQQMLPLTPKDMRLINWHFANLEYANATNIGNLSLSGWDQDMGNEFEGEHSQVIGGYQQVPYGLWSYPTKLDVRTNKIVTNISHDPTDSTQQRAVVQCEDGDSIMADRVVYTGSLGTLKHRTIQFSPPLPEWKTGAIDRLGFGVMNKVIMTFEQSFWDPERDMFGLLREPKNRESMVQEDYAANRGRFYLFWNCMKTTGLPVLIALMAGDAAHQAECTPDAEIVAEVLSQLRNVFKHVAVPDPLETIITRWATDKFTRGTYSYVSAEALPGDYDLMAKSIGNLHFAGEATCGTHPATVHGAYLSGQRAASEVIDSILGPIQLADPLVPDKGKIVPLGTGILATNGTLRQESTVPFLAPTPHTLGDPPARATKAPTSSQKQPKQQPKQQQQQQPPQSAEAAAQDAYEQAMLTAVYAETGPPIPRPARTGLNPFLLYQKDFWGKARAQCDAAHQAATKDPKAKAPRDAVRQALGQMWRQAPEDIKRPYIEQSEVNRQTNSEIISRWRSETAEWTKKSSKAKKRWRDANPIDNWLPPSKKQNQMGGPPPPLPAPALARAPTPAPAPAPAVAAFHPPQQPSLFSPGTTVSINLTNSQQTQRQHFPPPHPPVAAPPHLRASTTLAPNMSFAPPFSFQTNGSLYTPGPPKIG